MRPRGGAFHGVLRVTVKLEYFAGAACLLDQGFYPVHRERHGARVSGGEIDDAGAVLKDMPAVRFQAASIFQRKAESRASGAQCEVNTALPGACDSFPDAGVND